MKSIGHILKEMGFNPEAPIETQKAFFKHLIQDAESKQLKKEDKIITSKEVHSEQMEFDFGNDKKVS